MWKFIDAKPAGEKWVLIDSAEDEIRVYAEIGSLIKGDFLPGYGGDNSVTETFISLKQDVPFIGIAVYRMCVIIHGSATDISALTSPVVITAFYNGTAITGASATIPAGNSDVEITLGSPAVLDTTSKGKLSFEITDAPEDLTNLKVGLEIILVNKSIVI